MSGNTVVPYGLGTAWVGNVKVGNLPLFVASKGNEESNVELLTQNIRQVLATQRGNVVIDLAQVYGGGYTDIVVSKAIRAFDRENLFLLWKISAAALNSETDVMRSVENALNNLGVSHIDVLMTHETPDDLGFVRHLETTVTMGLARSIGLGRVTLPLLKKVMDVSETGITYIQNSGSLFVRQYLPDELVFYCENSGITVTAYRPIGRLIQDPPAMEKVWGFIRERNFDYTPAQVALAWSINKGLIAVGSTKNPDHMTQNLEAINLILSSEEMAALENL